MSDPTLPPPPSNLAPPPGYTAYEGTQFTQGGIRRLRGLSIGIVVAMAACALSAVISLGAIGSAKDASEDFLAGQLSGDDFDEKLAAFGVGGLLGFAGLLAGMVLSMIWLYRMISNHRTLGRTVFWAPIWAIFSWLLPPFLFIIPLLILIESWKAADPESPPGSDTWKQGGIGVPLIVWFAIFGIGRTVVSFLAGSPFDQFSREREDLAERFVDHASGVAIQAVVDIFGALAWIWVVWTLTQRHSRLTGEASAR